MSCQAGQNYGRTTVFTFSTIFHCDLATESIMKWKPSRWETHKLQRERVVVMSIGNTTSICQEPIAIAPPEMIRVAVAYCFTLPSWAIFCSIVDGIKTGRKCCSVIWPIISQLTQRSCGRIVSRWLSFGGLLEMRIFIQVKQLLWRLSCPAIRIQTATPDGT